MDSHYQDKMAMRLLHPYNGSPYSKKDSLDIEMGPWVPSQYKDDILPEWEFPLQS